MTIELSEAELTLVLRALQEHEIARNTRGLSTDEVHALLKKLQEAK